MKDMLGWILAAAGVYIIYEKFIVPSTAPASVPIQPGTTPTQAVSNPSTTVTAGSANPGAIAVPVYQGASNSSVSGLINTFASYAATNGLTQGVYNTDGWNYYYNVATGAQGPAPETMGISPRDSTMDYPSYINLMSRFLNNVTSLNGLGSIPGLTGLGYYGYGLGKIAQADYGNQNPSGANYRSMSRNRPSAIPTGWELTDKVVN